MPVAAPILDDDTTTTVTVKAPVRAPPPPPSGPVLSQSEQDLLEATQRANCTKVLEALQAGANPNVRDPRNVSIGGRSGARGPSVAPDQ